LTGYVADEFVGFVLGEVAGGYEVFGVVGDAADVLAVVPPRVARVAGAEVAVAVLVREVAGQFGCVGMDRWVLVVAVVGAVAVFVLVDAGELRYFVAGEDAVVEAEIVDDAAEAVVAAVGAEADVEVLTRRVLDFGIEGGVRDEIAVDPDLAGGAVVS